MLDVALRNVSFAYGRESFALRDVSLSVARSTHVAVTGPPGCGATTLLRLIAGTLRPAAGDVILGQRRANDIKPKNRPLLAVTAEPELSPRWSVQHALIAAVRSRTLDREDRHREFALAAEKWELTALLERRISTLSSTELLRAHLASIELLRPAVLVADRLFERANGAVRTSLADAFYRSMRVSATTVISAPSTREELAFSEVVAVLDQGRLVQSGSSFELFARPESDAAAVASGDVDVIPVSIRGRTVESVIGAWEVDAPPFQGTGVALVRPGDFRPARPGEESDLIFGVEEAGFAGGRWIARGLLSGGVTLRVELAPETGVHKGRLLALRYDPSRFRLLARELAPLQTTVPTDVVPPMRESR